MVAVDAYPDVEAYIARFPEEVYEQARAAAAQLDPADTRCVALRGTPRRTR